MENRGDEEGGDKETGARGIRAEEPRDWVLTALLLDASDSTPKGSQTVPNRVLGPLEEELGLSTLGQLLGGIALSRLSRALDVGGSFGSPHAACSSFSEEMRERTGPNLPIVRCTRGCRACLACSRRYGDSIG